jgi:hypothetical protein
MPDNPDQPDDIDFDSDPEFAPTEAVEQDKRGIAMSELESWERVIEGLKQAADGARQAARHRHPDLWNQLAEFLDTLRRAVIRDGGFDRPNDSKVTVTQWGGDGMSWGEASRRINEGLKGAAAGARQISLGQRMELKWTAYANAFDTIKKKAHHMAIAGSPLVVESGWTQQASGLLLPGRVH